MSVAERSTRTPASEAPTLLCGWGRTSHSWCDVRVPRGPEDVLERLQSRAGASVIARGAGRSYGDAAQNERGTVLDMNGLTSIVSIDEAAGVVTAQAGCTVAQLMDALAPHGLTLPVVPGTRFVTLGGAIASDIHGKNHHCDGAFARHVLRMKMCTPAQGLLEVSPQSDPELFSATLGGMGLTGVVLEASVRTIALGRAAVAVDIDRTDSLAETLELLAAREQQRFSVAWLDLLAEAKRAGRAIVTHADLIADRGEPRPARALASDPAVRVPSWFPGALLHPRVVRSLSAARWRAAPRRARGRVEALGKYFFPLDGVADWNRAYGSAGLVQYQFVVPDARLEVLVRAIELLRARGLPVYLAVCKRMGAASGGPLSFPIPGWTLALDLPARCAGLREALDDLDEIIAVAGGRVYLSKDARMRPEALRAMYPELARFEECRARVDPGELLQSDLARRLALCAANS